MHLCTTCRTNDICVFPASNEVGYCPDYQEKTPQERALLKWGTSRQLNKVAEEAAELAAALNRYFNDPAAVAEVIEEAADVEICAAYIRLVFGNEAMDKEVERKLKRLEGMIKQ